MSTDVLADSVPLIRRNGAIGGVIANVGIDEKLRANQLCPPEYQSTVLGE